MKTNTAVLQKYVRPFAITLCLAVVAYVLYFHNASGLVPGYSTQEIATYNSSSDWHSIWHNPVNAPYKVLLWATVALGHHSYLQTRLVAAGFGVLAVILFYIVAYKFHGTRTALLATTLFATTSGFLHTARLGSALVLQLAVLLYIAMLLTYRRLRRHRIGLGYVVVAMLGLLLYVPGMLWIELAGLFLIRRGTVRRLKWQGTVHTSLYALLGLLVIAPLLAAIIMHPAVGRELLGLPQQVSSLAHLPANFVHTLASIGFRSNGDPTFFVGHTPFLSIIGLTLFAIGLYAYSREIRTARSVFLMSSLIITPILIALEGAVGLSMLLPVVYLYVARGLDELSEDWLRVFPRNPIARFTGVSLICVMVAFAVLYQTRSYFVAWPHTYATRQVFNQRQP